jgi:hypothetical protein
MRALVERFDSRPVADAGLGTLRAGMPATPGLSPT